MRLNSTIGVVPHNCLFSWMGTIAFTILWAIPYSYGQIVPQADSVQCFFAGSGGLFSDPGGPGGDPTIDGASGNYPNCDCVTTTTICSVDGTPITLELQDFGVFSPFDWLVILDTDNPNGEVFPASILDDPNNSSLQLFNNSDGVGDGGAENYGAGAQEGASTLSELPTTSFTSSNPSGCLTFVFRASGVVDDPGWDALISTVGGTPHPGDNLDCNANISCFPPANLSFSDLTPTSLILHWEPIDTAIGYIVEYGPSGFALGSGSSILLPDTTSALITNLMENTFYDFYVITDCGDPNGISAAAGPLTVQTPFINPPAQCTYTLVLYDNLGNGWANNSVSVTVNGVTTQYTLDGVNDNGSEASFPITVLDGYPIEVTFNFNSFNTGTIELYDSDGLLLTSAITTPGLTEVYNDIATCPVCPAPNFFDVSITNVTDTTALISWSTSPEHLYYQIEWGPSGFPLGAGPTDTTTTSPYLLDSLNACVTYDVYVQSVCGQDSVSTSVGPFTFTTSFTPPSPTGDSCTYTLELFDSFGDGWNGAVLTITIGNQSADYTFTSGNEATFTFVALQNVPFIVSYSPGIFENEVSYNIIDPTGNIVFSDGPNPQTGEVATIIACPSCPSPLEVTMYDINADNAIVTWQAADETVPHIVEWGPLGFTLGTAQSYMASPGQNMVTLTGLQPSYWYDVYVYAVCDSTEQSKHYGPISFQTIWMNDVGVFDLVTPNPDGACNLGLETIGILLANYGQTPQSLFPFKYSVNGVVAGIPFPTDGFFTGVLGNDSLIYVEFDTKWDFSQPGPYHIEIWTELDTDNDRSNDTFAIDIITAYYLPLIEDFESLTFPETWTHSEFGNPVFAPNAHNNPTAVVADNLYNGDQSFELTTHRVALINEGDSLTFDYRYVDWLNGTAPTMLGNNDSLLVLISTDCGETWETVYTLVGTDHTPTTDFTTIAIDLSPWAGMAINVRIQAIWGQGNYWLDLDNINILGCPPTLGLSANIQNAQTASSNDGSITLNQPLYGVPPYTYEWDTGASTVNIVNLPPGVYTVTVTDSLGCTETAQFTVSTLVSSQEVITVSDVVLAPNPTDGLATLRFRLPQRSDAHIDIFSMQGIQMWQRSYRNILDQEEVLDIRDWAPGMYIIRIQVGDRPHFEKLILAK